MFGLIKRIREFRRNRHSNSIKQHILWREVFGRRLGCEPLEDRQLLSASVQLDTLGRSSALFVENDGQYADASARYILSGSEANVLMSDSGITLQAADSADSSRLAEVSVGFDGANVVAPIGDRQSDAVINYNVGDSTQWIDNVAAYEGVVYENLYSGIDLAVSSQDGDLKYEFHVAAGADYSQVFVSLDNIGSLSCDSSGSLHIQTALGELVDSAPIIYQIVDGKQVTVAGMFQLVDENTYTFAITGSYDPNAELIIDPQLGWSSYIAGTTGAAVDIESHAVAVDGDGNVFVTGETNALLPGADASSLADGNDTNAFVAKYSNDGTLLWTVYLGGSADDAGYGIAVDSEGNAVLTGYASSYDFTGTNSGDFWGVDNAWNSAFVAKISPDGELVWATYIDGSSYGEGDSIAVDSSDNVIIAGHTYRSNLAEATNASSGAIDAFAVKLDADGYSPMVHLCWWK